MADHIETIPQEMFDMYCEFRRGNCFSNDCYSVGDIIGHCTALDNEPLPRLEDGNIDFFEWAERFTGIEFLSDEWLFLFSFIWSYVDNTPTGAAKRIRYFVENGLPNNWLYIMYGQDPLPY